MNQILINKLEQLILAAKKILVLTHQKPDGDALGSGLAFSEFLDTLGKANTFFALGPISSTADFLPGRTKVKSNFGEINLADFDLIAILDCGDLKQTGIEAELRALPPSTSILNIDHHQTNENFGAINIVNPESSSTAEIVFTLFEELNFPVSKNAATLLLTGLITDTANFSNPATTFASLEAAGKLLSRGAKLNEISTNVLKNKSLDVLKFWGTILSRLTENKELGVVTTIITKEDLELANLDEEALDGVTNFLNNLKGAKMVLVLKALEDGKIKGSFRTTTEGIDVSRLAKTFGGGGHAKAAGFTIPGKLVKIDGGWRIE
ncbi:bifunctional oligoribonuclease/PAP phosphatase NrnA [Candidatus Falkowbacteria bacterium]|nr:bifunctional oligoribonuclease/PAP phosphatase NrnA [Candidatus Falkowbacteria bacterium]